MKLSEFAVNGIKEEIKERVEWAFETEDLCELSNRLHRLKNSVFNAERFIDGLNDSIDFIDYAKSQGVDLEF